MIRLVGESGNEAGGVAVGAAMRNEEKNVFVSGLNLGFGIQTRNRGFVPPPHLYVWLRIIAGVVFKWGFVVSPDKKEKKKKLCIYFFWK